MKFRVRYRIVSKKSCCGSNGCIADLVDVEAESKEQAIEKAKLFATIKHTGDANDLKSEFRVN